MTSIDSVRGLAMHTRGLGLCAGLLVAFGASAQAAAPAPAAKEAWRAALAHISLPQAGCFKANYPDSVWMKVACIAAPQVPYIPLHAALANGGSDTVGDGHDYSAVVTSLISAGRDRFRA